MVLSINGNQVAKGKTQGLFTTEPIPNRIRVGENDSQNVVGENPGGWRFTGRIGNKSSLVLKNPEAAEKIAMNGDEDLSSGNALITLSAVPHEMRFDKATFQVKAGTQVTIDFENPDFMQHNLAIGQKGSLEVIGEAADQLAKSNRGAEHYFIPNIPEVIASTQLVNPETQESLVFVAPTEAGDYPFICTVPSHRDGMNGIMQVR
jgi:azurin